MIKQKSVPPKCWYRRRQNPNRTTDRITYRTTDRTSYHTTDRITYRTTDRITDRTADRITDRIMEEISKFKIQDWKFQTDFAEQITLE